MAGSGGTAASAGASGSGGMAGSAGSSGSGGMAGSAGASGSGGVAGGGGVPNDGGFDAGTGGAPIDAGVDALVDSGGDAATTEKVVFDFYAGACAVSWQQSKEGGANATPLVCDKSPVADDGSVLKSPMATLDGNLKETSVLKLQPPSVANGVLDGIFSGLDLKSVAKPVLKTRLGCLHGATNCDVQWQIIVREEAKSNVLELELGSEKIDGNSKDVEMDLTPHKNKKMKIVFVVTSNGVGSSDDVLGLASPRIVDAP